MAVKVKEYVDYWKDESELSHLSGQDIVAFIGPTKAGKSTTINYLLGNTLICRKCPETEDILLVKEDERDGGPQIGDEFESCTFKPCSYGFKNKYQLWDFPGFGDNKGTKQEIANAISMKMILSNVKTVKFILVVPFETIKHRNPFPFFENLYNLYNISPDIANNLILVASKMKAGNLKKLLNTLHNAPFNNADDDQRKCLIGAKSVISTLLNNDALIEMPELDLSSFKNKIKFTKNIWAPNTSVNRLIMYFCLFCPLSVLYYVFTVPSLVISLLSFIFFWNSNRKKKIPTSESSFTCLVNKFQTVYYGIFKSHYILKNRHIFDVCLNRCNGINTSDCDLMISHKAKLDLLDLYESAYAELKTQVEQLVNTNISYRDFLGFELLGPKLKIKYQKVLEKSNNLGEILKRLKFNGSQCAIEKLEYFQHIKNLREYSRDNDFEDLEGPLFDKIRREINISIEKINRRLDEDKLRNERIKKNEQMEQMNKENKKSEPEVDKGNANSICTIS